jgi:hypothetical protein
MRLVDIVSAAQHEEGPLESCTTLSTQLSSSSAQADNGVLRVQHGQTLKSTVDNIDVDASDSTFTTNNVAK